MADMDDIPTTSLGEGDDGADDEPEADFAEVGKEVDISKDGGIIKKILVEGASWEKPEKGDKVEVHYVGTLASDGSVFDSSRERGEPFTFTLGTGGVIKGWDVGVATMKKGEKAVLTCKPEYAYGAAGSPPKIPADATLNFEVELLGWRSVKDISGDGGVIKTITKEGSDWQKPSDKDEVLVRYAVRAKGSDAVVAESPESGAEFTLRDGHLLKAFGVALKTMKKGEEASLDVSPAYGPIAAGEGGVPADAPLQADLTLLSWKKVEDLSGDGVVVKKTLHAPEGWQMPNAGSKVRVRYTLRTADGDLVEERGEGNELEFVVDEDEVVEGLDLGVSRMKVDEKAELTVSPAYAYKDQSKELGLGTVPPGASLVYTIELVHLEKAKDSWEMNDEEKVAAAGAAKDAGNKAFKAGRWARAAKKYKAATEAISFDDKFTDELKRQAREVKKSANLNLAAVHLKTGAWREARDACNKVLEKNSGNTKALYRRAQAHMAAGDYVEAELDIKAALQLEPGNRDVRSLHVRFRRESAAASAKEAQFFSKAFQRMAREPEPAAAPAPAANGVSGEHAAKPAESGGGDVDMGEAAGGAPDHAPGGVGQAAPVEAVAKASTASAADVGVVRP